MMNYAISITIAGLASMTCALADIVVPVHTIRAGDVVYPEDLTLRETSGGSPSFSPDEILGLEAKRVLYAGRPVRRSDFGPPSLVERNQIVTLIFQTPALKIATEGRALGRGGEGDVLRVINLESRSTVTGRVGPNGAVWVNQ